MASTSSALIPFEYDVFLSFRGGDTRHSFTDHLYEALRKAGIRTFRDENDILEGQELKPEIERSIRNSRASIIIFSKNFANSSWCLDELLLILEQKRTRNHFVLPVFYDVDPSDVRNQRGSFKIKAHHVFKRPKWTRDNVKRWRAALTEVANLKGIIVEGNEATFIQSIVEKVYSHLDLELYTTPTDLTEIETRAERIDSWLCDNSNSPVLAICGMGGSGKTTLAKHIYYSNKHNFESKSFLEDIENKPGVLLGLQKQLLRDVSKNNNMMISNVYEGALQIEKAMRMNRVLIVVDDIDDNDTLSTLFGTKVFSTQSKIIITTRHLNIDTWSGSISYGCHVNKIELLNDHESLELLNCHAFSSKIPMVGFEELAVQITQYCEGNPLALKVLGSSLSVSAQDRCTGNDMIETWRRRINSLKSLKGVSAQDRCTRNDMIETWRRRINSLNSLKGDIDPKIHCVLQKSFKSLPSDSYRELFLHIACFFIGEYASHAEKILEKDWHEKTGIKTLINRCLVTKSRNGLNLAMHKLLQDMAAKIVREESKDPAKRSRVWHKDESYSLLSKGDGSETIEGLSVDMGDAEQGITSDVLNSLKILDLKSSHKLVGICNLHRLPILETLYLDYCTNLTHVCKTLGDLEKLSYLSLVGCTKLWKASSNQMFLNQPERLKDICTSGGIPEQPLCSSFQSLSTLHLNDNPFEIPPSYIDIQSLVILDLISCPNLKSLPSLPRTLERLYVDWCSSLEYITFLSGRFTLREFDYEGCFKLNDIQGLFKLVSIEKLDEADLGNMQWIKAYQNHKVDLVGDVITKGRTFIIQMLYEYGIKSTYVQCIKDQSMATHEYTSSSGPLSFRVPFHPMKHRIRGLNVTILYRASSGEDRDKWPPLFVKISNRTKGVTWIYNPVVYCKPMVDKDVVWLSYWSIGNSLDAGDEVLVKILVEKGTIARSGYGASLVYMDDGEVENEEKCDERVKEEEVIGGDLSRFEVTKGSYYLCRRDFFRSVIPASLFGETFPITDSRRWRTNGQVETVYKELYDTPNRDRCKYEEVTLGVGFNSENETEIEKAVSSVEGVETVSVYKEIRRLVVSGCFDSQAVVTCVMKFEKMVQVLASRRFQAQESTKKSLLHKMENGLEGKIDEDPDDEFFDFSETFV